MSRPHIPNYYESVRKRGTRRKLEHAGYKFEQYEQHSDWCLKRPTGQILKHYKHLGHALNGAEADIRKARKHVANPKTTQSQKEYWGKVLDRYDTL